MLFMIVERFRHGAEPVYERFKKQGRLSPPDLHYVSSWVAEDMETCWQVMECESRELLDRWMAAWRDLVDFEVVPVMESREAVARFSA
jgi:hypothetical protein